MKGDRITVVSSLMFETKEEVLPVYAPVLNPDGSFKTTYDGGVELARLGGVKSGSSGTIQGPSIKVHKSQLLHLQEQTSALGGTNDFQSVVPVFLDAYQQVGWFPTDHVRVVGGSRLTYYLLHSQ